MNWRNRVKKSFEDIEQGVKNNNKKGLKTTFTCYPQNPPNPEKETTSEVESQTEPEPTPAQNIPAPAPPGLGIEYTRLWNQAWTLADYIDNPQGAPLAERKAKLPELMQMRDRMAEIENAGGLVLDDTPPPHPAESKDSGTWTKWVPIEGRNPITQDNCPARCKTTGKCYGQTWFTGKPGPFPGPECDFDRCRWIPQQAKI